MTTPELIGQAGEGHIGPRNSWYGSVLRDLANHGYVHELRRESGGWQKGHVIRWGITIAGIARLADYERLRSLKSERAAKRERAAENAAAKAARQPALDRARQTLVITSDPDEKYGIARSLRDEGCTYQEIADLFGMSREWIRLVLDQGTWHARAQNKGARDANV